MSLKEILGEMRLETDVWDTIEVIDRPACDVETRVVDRPYAEPERASRAREQWFADKVLPDAMNRLQEESERKEDGFEYFIGKDEVPEGHVPLALFRKSSDNGTKRLNFDGKTANLKDILQEGEKTVIGVYPIAFSEWVACQNPEFTKAYKEACNDWIPYAGIGISSVVKTTDGLFVLTQRGVGTPNYPGRLFILGGGLKPEDDVAEAVTMEILEESGLRVYSHYIPDYLFVTALVVEKSYAGGEHMRPEIVSYIETNVTWDNLVDLQEETEYQPDVTNLVPLAIDPVNFTGRVALTGATGELLPAAEAGLVYGILRMMEEGGLEYEYITANAENLIKTLNAYERQIYSLPKLK